MRILIVEDETAAYDNLVGLLGSIDPGIEVAANTESVNQTVKWLKSNMAPDLILMDIQLSDGSAFKVFDRISLDVPVIFTTAYDDYAIDAFKVNSIDYLLKPIKKDDLERALEKFKRLNRNDLIKYLSGLANLSVNTRYRDKILVSVRDRLTPLPLSDVSFFYTSDKNTRIFLKNGTAYPYSKSLEQIESMLNPCEFFRANKQFIVSRHSVKHITVWFDNRLFVTLDVEPPERLYVSKNKASEFKAWVVNDKDI